MPHDARSYAKMINSLLPKGKAFNRNLDSNQGKILVGYGGELSRVEKRAEELLVESRVSETEELIDEHEIDYGVDKDETKKLDERRAVLRTKQLAQGGQWKQYFIDLAARFNFVATIEEYRPCWADIARADDPCGDQDIIFEWTVYLDSTEDYPQIQDIIKELIEKKPAHAHLNIVPIYGGYTIRAWSLGFDDGFGPYTPRAFDDGFDFGFERGRAFSSGFLYGFG